MKPACILTSFILVASVMSSICADRTSPDLLSHSPTNIAPFSFRIVDADTHRPVQFVSIYWTETWQDESDSKPFHQRAGFLFSGGTNVICVSNLNEAVENTFRFASKDYEPVTLTYNGKDGLPSVSLYNTRKSPRPLATYTTTNGIIAVQLHKSNSTFSADGKLPKIVTDKNEERYRLTAPVLIQQAIDAENEAARHLHLFNQGLQQHFPNDKKLVEHLQKLDERYGRMHAERVQKLRQIEADLKQSGGELYHYDSFNADFNADFVNTNSPAGSTDTDEGWLILSGGKIYKKY